MRGRFVPIAPGGEGGTTIGRNCSERTADFNQQIAKVTKRRIFPGTPLAFPFNVLPNRMTAKASGGTPDAATGTVVLPKIERTSLNVMSKNNPECFPGR